MSAYLHWLKDLGDTFLVLQLNKWIEKISGQLDTNTLPDLITDNFYPKRKIEDFRNTLDWESFRCIAYFETFIFHRFERDPEFLSINFACSVI